MPPRTTPPPKGSFYPTNDAATHRDLLLFEERLKTTAIGLQRRKFRYKVFLAQLLIVIVFLLSEVRLGSPFLSLPYKFLLQKTLPDIYTHDTEVVLHPYFASGLLFVSVTTLVLFFASGMYTEKISYANQYVPHANRALRAFNMYLNVRRPPLRSKVPFNPLAFLFPRPPPRSSSPPPPRSETPPSNPTTAASLPAHSESAPVPISPIPPATNPRGELIFSSRVDKSFREAYTRHRAAFERRREERERIAWSNTWLGWALLKLPFTKKLWPPPPPPPPSSSLAAGSNPSASTTPTRTLSLSSRGRGTTPTGSRRSSPVPRKPSVEPRSETPPKWS